MNYQDKCAVCGKTYGEHKACGDNCPKGNYKEGEDPYLETVFTGIIQPAHYSLTLEEIQGIWGAAYYAGVTDYRKNNGLVYTEGVPDMKQYLSTVLGISAGEVK